MVGSSRRTLLSLGASALAAPWIIGSARAQQREITLVAFSGIFEDNYKPTVIEPFMRANPDIKVNYFGAATSAQMLGTIRAQKNAPQTDVCILDLVVAKAGGDESLFAQVTADDLPVMKQLAPRALIPNVPGPAVMFDTLSLMYAPKKLATAPTSWRELWKKEHDGQIAIDAPPNTIGVGFTVIANKLAGGTDYLDLRKGIDLIGQMAPLVQTWEPKPDSWTALTNGSIELAVGLNARAQVFASRAPDRFAVSFPEEGSIFQVNTINLVKGSRDVEAARKFMDYALSPVAQKAFTERMFYAPSNLEAQVSADALGRTVSSADRMAKMIDVDWVKLAGIRDNITEQWRRNIINKR